MTIADRIKFLRGEWSQTDFAEKLGSDQRLVSAWETGKAEPSSTYLQAIHREFNVNIHWILTGEGAPYIKNDPGYVATESETKNDRKDHNKVEMWIEIIQEVEKIPDGLQKHNWIKDVARRHNTTASTIYRKIQRYNKDGLDGLRHIKSNRGTPKKWTPEALDYWHKIVFAHENSDLTKDALYNLLIEEASRKTWEIGSYESALWWLKKREKGVNLKTNLDLTEKPNNNIELGQAVGHFTEDVVYLREIYGYGDPAIINAIHSNLTIFARTVLREQTIKRQDSEIEGLKNRLAALETQLSKFLIDREAPGAGSDALRQMADQLTEKEGREETDIKKLQKKTS